jgi:short-subunit dehydrogenase/uncharacterized OsmC-like protein
MKIKTNWYARSFPNNWEFYSECEEGHNIDIAVKNDFGIQKIAPSPKEVVLQGMAACTSVDIVSNLQKMRQPLQSLTVECDATQTEAQPKVFKDCLMIYKVTGEQINVERVAHCVQLSFTKYCGVSTMIEKSGCHITPKLFVNGKEIDIWDPEDIVSNKFNNWLNSIAKKAPNGIALVTGSSRGIGAALAKQLASQGFAVIPTSRSKSSFDNESIFNSLYLDVSKSGSILNLRNFLKKNAVKLNLLVHNAGVAAGNGEDLNLSALTVNIAEMRHIYETNVFGLIETNNVLLEVMEEDSTIAMVSSTMGHKSRDSHLAASYRLSKRSVIQFAMQAALQLKSENKNIAILSLHPGSVITEMNPSGKISVEKSANDIGLLLSNKFHESIKQKNGGFWVFDDKETAWKCIE